MTVARYGWDSHFSRCFEPYKRKGFHAGRVISENKNHFRLLTTDGEVQAKCTGSMFYRSSGKGDLPVVGDWVAFKLVKQGEETGRIQHVLDRKSKFSRKITGKVTREQPVAANVDTIFLVSGLDSNFNLRRIERYLTLAWESGSTPVILLNKSDVCSSVEAKIHEVEMVSGLATIHLISALYQQGLSQLEPYLTPGKTVAALGSSGTGKSTLLNSLLGQRVQQTKETGVAGKGMHTTRLRELFILPGGALFIDTPGMRELQLWNADSGLEDTFSDIVMLANECRFADCQHQSEPDCAVKKAVDSGDLDKKRYENYINMQKELLNLDARQDKKSMLEKKATEKRFGKMIKRFKKNKKKH